MSTPSVMLFSPVRVDAPTLSLVLQSHNALRGIATRVYHDDNTDDESKLLLQWEAQRGALVTTSLPNDVCPLNSGDEYRTEETHVWTEERISRVSCIRNAAIDAFLASACEFLFIVDADVVMHPQMVEHLVSLNLPVVSEVFWTQWEQKAKMYAPNVWDSQPYAHWNAESALRLRVPGQYNVGGLGACTLIRRDVLENKNIRYVPVHSLNLEGEDRWFCVRCEAHGIPLVADTHFPPFHVYRPSLLDEAKIWFEQGCSPSYFANVWLNEEWEQQVRGIANRQGGVGTRKSVALCIPGETFSASWVMGLINALPAMNREYDMQIVNVFSSNPSVTRQTIARTLLQNPKTFDYVLWVDDDNVLSEEHVKLLLEVMETYPDIDLVAGWCDITRSQYDFADNKVSCGTFDDHGRCVQFTAEEVTTARGLVGIDWTGFPCVMMRGSLITKLGPKSFSSISDDSLEWGFYGEDVSFCKRAKEIGAVMVMDPRIKLPHLKLRDANRPVAIPASTERISE